MRCHELGALAALRLHTASMAAYAAPVTLEQLMQDAYPMDLVAANRDAAVASAFDARGCPSVWVADVTHRLNARAFTGDDDYSIEALREHDIHRGEMILPNEIHNLARHLSSMRFFEAADHN